MPRPRWSRGEYLFLSKIGIVANQPLLHGFETPNEVDPQCNILYWGSKWNLHKVCWGAVGCEWGTTSIYFGITYVCFILSRLPVFIVEPQYQHRYFFFLSKVSLEGHTQNPQKNSCCFKIWMGFVGQILIKLRTSSIWGFSYVVSHCNLCKHAGDHWIIHPTYLSCLGLCGMDV